MNKNRMQLFANLINPYFIYSGTEEKWHGNTSEKSWDKAMFTTV